MTTPSFHGKLSDVIRQSLEEKIQIAKETAHKAVLERQQLLAASEERKIQATKDAANWLDSEEFFSRVKNAVLASKDSVVFKTKDEYLAQALVEVCDQRGLRVWSDREVCKSWFNNQTNEDIPGYTLYTVTISF